MRKTRVTIVRHGETEWNVVMRLQGMRNSNLTERGIEQAKQAAKALQHKSFDKLICSDLDRAIKTAEFINTFHKLNIETDNSIRERNFGIMEGLTREEILSKHPETYNAYMKRRDTYPIPEGESLVVFYARVIGGINNIVRSNEGNHLLLVSHGGVLDCMIRMIFEYPLSAPRRFSIYNAAINEFSCQNDQWQLDSWGNIEHQKSTLKSLDELHE